MTAEVRLENRASADDAAHLPRALQQRIGVALLLALVAVILGVTCEWTTGAPADGTVPVMVQMRAWSAPPAVQAYSDVQDFCDPISPTAPGGCGPVISGANYAPADGTVAGIDGG